MEQSVASRSHQSTPAVLRDAARKGSAMKVGRYVYPIAVLLTLAIGFGVWQPKIVKAVSDSDPKFTVDTSWPKPLPAPVGTDGVAHRWVTGEVAGTCVDSNNRIFTVNRGWEVGVTVGGVIQGNESGAIVGQDASASAIPSPPVVAYDEDGNVVASFGNPALVQTGISYGASEFLPYGLHGCYVDYQDNVWIGGNGDGIVQKYSQTGTLLLQIGTKGVCDGPSNNSTIGGTTVYATCGEAHDFNDSHTLLNEPADIAIDPQPDPVTGKKGDIYIADGYGNHRIVVFSSTGTYLRQFGTKCASTPCPDGTYGATGGGHPHCVVLGNDELVYTCDRPDSRLEVWTKEGVFVRSIPIDPASSASAGDQAAILKAGTRACDMTFWPNIDYLGDNSPTDQKYIIDVDLGNDNTWVLRKESGAMIGALGRCGVAPCPGHNPGEFAFSHTTSTDSHGNVYVAETITGRRIQKFVPEHRREW